MTIVSEKCKEVGTNTPFATVSAKCKVVGTNTPFTIVSEKGREVGTNGPSTLVQSAGSFNKPFTFVWAFYPRYIPSRTVVTMKRITTFLHEIDNLSPPLY